MYQIFGRIWDAWIIYLVVVQLLWSFATLGTKKSIYSIDAASCGFNCNC
jgi:hypothetical protein